LLYEDETRIRETIPHVRRTVPARMLRRDGVLGERRLELRIVATTPDWFDLVRREILAGRILSARDAMRSAPVCVLTESGARRLLAGAHTVGERVRIGSELFEVVGIIREEMGSGAIESPDQEFDVYLPLEVAQRLFGEVSVRHSQGSREMERVELHRILVEIDAIEHVESVAAAIETMLARFHRKTDYRVSVPLALLRQAEATKRTFNIVLGSIAGISLLVGGIGIMNIMLASVTERTREIGIRRAIGARRRQIIVQFLIEAIVLSGMGGIIGLALGALIPALITRFSGMPTVIPLYSLVLSFGISALIGVVFGLYPAYRAAMLDPIAALRHE
jgi:putative ABC transport system permease protein